MSRKPSDPHAFNNPRQSGQESPNANRAKTSGRPATTRPNTIIGDAGSADGPTKSSRDPHLGSVHHRVRVTEGPQPGFPENYGK